MVFLSLFLFLFLNNPTCAQSQWTEAPTGQRFFSGIPLSCADVNGDGVDDLIVLDQAKHLWLGLHDGISRFFWISLPYHHTFAAWSVNVADIDNNGWNDILISGESTGLVVLYQTAGNFISRVADVRYFFSQAAAAYDINQDGWLDFTLCDDNNATRIYLNNGAGDLEYDTALIHLTLPEAGKSGGNYGCIWSDYDRDGDGDLYLSKCRAGVDDPKDARRINLHYVKDSAGWTERGAYNGVDVSDQSWVSLMEDFDRDGLFDLLVVNHYTPCRIFRQKPDHRFEERTAESGLEFSAIAIQAVPGDFDNDGDIDVLLTGNTVELWLNDGQMHFTKADLHPGDRRFSSCAAGDFNGDGWLDVYASYADLLNTPNNQQDRLWLNPGGSHHHAGFRLQGMESNRNGIGAIVQLYSGGSIQVRELHGGESYGMQNSLRLHFGLGARDRIDSLVVHWPSGQEDRYFDLPADREYVLREGGCLFDRNRLPKAQRLAFCVAVDTILQAATGYTGVLWNDGSRTASLRVTRPGVYYYSAQDPSGCYALSNPISVELDPRLHPRLNRGFAQILCEGEFLELFVPGIASLAWSNGSLADTLQVFEEGNYFAGIQAYCGVEYTDTIAVKRFPLPSTPVLQPDTLFGAGPAEWTGDADELNWFEEERAAEPLFTGRHFRSDTVRQSRSYWVERFSRHSYPAARGGLKEPSYAFGPYHAAFLNNKMLFNVYQDLYLDSVTLFTDDPGERLVELQDHSGGVLARALVDLPKGRTQVYLGFEIPASANPYFLTTNTEKNVSALGTISPKLYRSDQQFYYPFFIQDLLRIFSSDKGDSYFYYFYDWVVRKTDETCVSERVELPVVVLPVGTETGPAVERVRWLNRGRTIQLETANPEAWVLEVIAPDGRLVFTSNGNRSGQPVDLHNVVPGFYVLRLYDTSREGYRRIKWWISP